MYVRVAVGVFSEGVQFSFHVKIQGQFFFSFPVSEKLCETFYPRDQVLCLATEASPLIPITIIGKAGMWPCLNTDHRQNVVSCLGPKWHVSSGMWTRHSFYATSLGQLVIIFSLSLGLM